MIKYRLVAFILFPSVTLGGGFQINTQGIKGLGMGGAFTAIASDASSVFYNPGAMSFLEESSVILGNIFMKSKTSYLSPFDGNITTDNPLHPLIHFYGNFKINEKFSTGIGFNTLYNYSTKWDDNWEGRYIVQEGKLKTYFIEPAISYMINEKIGIGTGYFYGFGNYKLRKALPVNGTSSSGEAEWKGNGKCMGFNLGLFVRLSDEASVGLTYRSSMDFKIKKGDATFTGIPASATDVYPTSSTFTSRFNLPSSVSAAIAYKFTEELTTTVQVDLDLWSRMDSIRFEFSDESLSMRSGPQLNNTISGRVGAQYDFTEEFSLRGGVAYDQSPYPDEHLTPEIPDANKILFSFGAGYQISRMLSADITIAIENYFERQGQDIETNLKGSFKTINNIIGIGLNYNF